MSPVAYSNCRRTILLLDQAMPQKTGLEALQDLQEVYKGQTIVFAAEIETRQVVEAFTARSAWHCPQKCRNGSVD
jgi:DNA-binding NarL/FixJ family response regulator